jgi:hypothetical protein
MSSAQLAVFLILWLVVASLACLVLALYRAVDKAYRQGGVAASPGLPAGVAMPTLEVPRGAGVGHIEARDANERWLMLFVSPTCDSCKQLLREGLGSLVVLPVTVVVTHGDTFAELTEFVDGHRDVAIEYLMDASDARHQAKVERVPFAYVLRGSTILAGGLAAASRDISALISAADEYEVHMKRRVEGARTGEGGD